MIDLDSLGIVAFLSKRDEDQLEQTAGAKRHIFQRSIRKWTRICHALCVILGLGVVGSYAYQISRALRAPFAGVPLLQVVVFGAVEGVQAFFAIGFLLVIMLHVRMMRKLIMVQLRESMRALLASRLFERAKTVPSFARHAVHMTDDVLGPSEKFVSTFVWVFGLTLVVVTLSVMFSVLSPLRYLGIGRYTYTSLFAIGVILAMFGNMFAQLDEILFRVRAPFRDARVMEELRETVSSIRSVSAATAASFPSEEAPSPGANTWLIGTSNRWRTCAAASIVLITKLTSASHASTAASSHSSPSSPCVQPGWAGSA